MSQQQTDLEMGQRWAAWVPGRQQWLLATLIRQNNGRVTLQFDPRYGIRSGDDEREIDAQDLLSTPSLFRRVAHA